MKNQAIGEHALTLLSATHIIQRAALAANLNNTNELSLHSLRHGLATSAASANTPIQTIMRAGRWKSVNTVMAYIEAQERLSENAVTTVLKSWAARTDE